MKHRVQCPYCQRALNVPDKFVGTKARCPACSLRFLVRLPEQSSALKELPPAPIRPPEIEERRSNPNLQECPDCYRMVSKAAYACPNCGRPLRGKSIECYLTISREYHDYYSIRDIAASIDGRQVARLGNGGTATVQVEPGSHRVELGMYGMLGGEPGVSMAERFEITEGQHLILAFTPAGGFFGNSWVGEWTEKID
jgi:DNA-directed RNA polymerase subunit RPC12/RpoP